MGQLTQCVRLEKHPDSWKLEGNKIFAYGNTEPNKGGWVDTYQLNYINFDVQMEMIYQLKLIANNCDGVRTDMAMLSLTDNFSKSWKDYFWKHVKDENLTAYSFWSRAIAEVKKIHPDFLFIAEAYWNEWELQQEGFDYIYDKILYDRLKTSSGALVNEHLEADLSFQTNLLRFLENHDEQRVAQEFTTPKHFAAALITFLSTGLRFFHDGQLEGRKSHVSVHLCRRKEEVPNVDIKTFYNYLLPLCNVTLQAEWHLLVKKPGWALKESVKDFVSFLRIVSDNLAVFVVVNYSQNEGECSIEFKGLESYFKDKTIKIENIFTSETFVKQGNDLLQQGWFFHFNGWGYNVFYFKKIKYVAHFAQVLLF